MSRIGSKATLMLLTFVSAVLVLAVGACGGDGGTPEPSSTAGSAERASERHPNAGANHDSYTGPRVHTSAGTNGHTGSRANVHTNA